MKNKFNIIISVLLISFLILLIFTTYSGNSRLNIIEDHIKDIDIALNTMSEYPEIRTSDDIIVMVGETSLVPLAIIGLKNPVVRYVSQNSHIATIDNDGYITGQNEGYTFVDILAEDTNSKMLYKRISIGVFPNYTTISIDEPEIKLKIGESYQLHYQYYPNNSEIPIIFKSLDESIVGVSEIGYVTARSKGITEVYVQAEGGEEIIKTSCTVYVE